MDGDGVISLEDFRYMLEMHKGNLKSPEKNNNQNSARKSRLFSITVVLLFHNNHNFVQCRSDCNAFCITKERPRSMIPEQQKNKLCRQFFSSDLCK